MAETMSRSERADQTAMWRWGVIRDAIDEELTARQRGAAVRGIASRAHPAPNGGTRTVSRETVDRWVRAWRDGGLMGLRPSGRACAPRTPAEVLDLAAALKKERPWRTAAQVRRVMVRSCGDAPSESTILRHFRRLGLGGAPAPEPHGRFQADFPNELWVADALHGPRVAGRKTYLFAFMDDHSRYVVGARWAHSEDHARFAIALRPALAACGVPGALYVDNGAAMVDKALARACARLGVRLTHSEPRRPEGRGKIERLFNTVNGQFLSEVAPDGEDGARGGSRVASLDELNSLFDAWLAQVYHRAVNDTTGQAPADRWEAGWARATPRRATLEEIAEAFKWSAARRVRRDGTVLLEGNAYEVDPSLVGRRVELVYDPYDMGAGVDVLVGGAPAGRGRPHVIGRHVHKKAAGAARDEGRGPAGGAATGIDYLRLLERDRREEIAAAGIDYRALSDDEAAQDLTGPGGPGGGPDGGGRDGEDADDGWEQGVLV
ncbi:MAG: DDE-type integrase/transposase/recombinase [Bifidobacteriaceae bacterium]|jgi:putative transposase|nr:DDE-type integrase/transposase/recombinase [Bifidobacteriaceae bacterium]